MIALIQRVGEARVEVGSEMVAQIGAGLLALVAIQPGDGEAQAQRLLERLLGYRVFADDEGRMNRSLAQTGGGLLLVSQFTLAADTKQGMRPGFSTQRRRPRGNDGSIDWSKSQKNATPPVEIRAVWRPYEGQPRQRRARDVLAGGEVGRIDLHLPRTGVAGSRDIRSPSCSGAGSSRPRAHA